MCVCMSLVYCRILTCTLLTTNMHYMWRKIPVPRITLMHCNCFQTRASATTPFLLRHSGLWTMPSKTSTSSTAPRAAQSRPCWRSSKGCLAESCTTSPRRLLDNKDDGEAGAGAKLLGVLKDLDVVGVAVIVSRWYGGKNLGISYSVVRFG